jgi:tetratricopeptide (TPR) repeat protein
MRARHHPGGAGHQEWLSDRRVAAGAWCGWGEDPVQEGADGSGAGSNIRTDPGVPGILRPMPLARGLLKYIDAIRGTAVAADLAALGIMGIGAVGGAVASPVLVGGAVAIAGIAGLGILSDWQKNRQLDAICRYLGEIVQNQGDQQMVLEQVLALAIERGSEAGLPEGVTLGHIERFGAFLTDETARERIIAESPSLRTNLLGVMAAHFDAIKEEIGLVGGEVAELRNELNRDFSQLMRFSRASPPVWIPEMELTHASRFRFEAQRAAMVGRDAEMAELQGFLADERPFLWWLWTGEAGMGKSRLALQLCRENWRAWNVGFIDWKTEKFEKWDLWSPDAPTLIVFDYVARHVADIRNAIEIMRTRSALEHPVRFLLLERPIPKMSDWEGAKGAGFAATRFSLSTSGTWWDELCPHGETPIVDSLYQQTRSLAGLDHGAAKAILSQLARIEAQEADEATIDHWATVIRDIDEKCRPLLVAMGFEAIRDAGAEVPNWTVDQLVNHIVQRETEKFWHPALKDAGVAVDRFMNLLIFAAMCPGLTIDSPVFDDLALKEVLPSRLQYGDGSAFARLVPDATQTAIPSLAPDIIAECLVAAALDAGIERDDRLIAGAWRHHPEALADFMKRLVQTLPDADAVDRMLDRDRAARDGPTEAIGRIWMQRGHAHFLRGAEGDAEREIEDYGAVIKMPDASAEQRASALVNRGVRYGKRGSEGDSERAIADYSAVLEMPDAPAEQRAKAFYNRGVRYGKRGSEGDSERAIADYSAVLEMPDAPAEQRAEASHNLCVSYGQGGSEGDAQREIADYTLVIEMADAPAELRAWALGARGMSHVRSGSLGDAVQDLLKALNEQALPDEPRQRALAALLAIAAAEQTCDGPVLELRREFLKRDDLPPDLRRDIQARLDECESA